MKETTTKHEHECRRDVMDTPAERQRVIDASCDPTVIAQVIAQMARAEWRVRLICCGRDDGAVTFPTWEDAEDFRVSYVAAEGHDRAAIIERP